MSGDPMADDVYQPTGTNEEQGDALDEGARAIATKDEVATDVGIDAGAAGAEEAAVHVVEDPEGP